MKKAYLCIGTDAGFELTCKSAFGDDVDFVDPSLRDSNGRHKYETQIENFYGYKWNLFKWIWAGILRFFYWRDGRLGDFGRIVVIDANAFTTHESKESLRRLSKRLSNNYYFAILSAVSRVNAANDFSDCGISMIMSRGEGEAKYADFLVDSFKRAIVSKESAKGCMATSWAMLATIFVPTISFLTFGLPSIVDNRYGDWNCEIIKDIEKNGEWQQYQLVIQNKWGSPKSNFRISSHPDSPFALKLANDTPRLNSGENHKIVFYAKRKAGVKPAPYDLEISVGDVWNFGMREKEKERLE